MNNADIAVYAADYNEAGLRKKLARFAGRMGRGLLVKALLLKRVLCKRGVPLKAKVTIMGALAYLVCPVDAVPDFVAVLGFTDDLGAVMIACSMVSAYTDAEDEAAAEAEAARYLSGAA